MRDRSLLLDEIKGLAMLAVIVFHLGYFKLGYLGVDVFLVIAGYLTASSWFYMEDFSPLEFLRRRFQRLWPMVAIVCFVSLFLGYWTMLPDDYENLSQSVVASLSFMNNVLCRISSSDYWAQNNEYKPLLHFWYLGVLMQLYIAFAIIAMSVNNCTNRLRAMRVTVLIVTIGSAILWFCAIGPQPVRFYYMPWRFFEFGIGILLFCFGGRIPKCFSIRVPGVAVIGKMSLSIYVWHYVILAFYRYVITPTVTWVFLVFYVAALLGLSWLSFKIVEQSKSWVVMSIRGLWKVILPSVVIVFSLALMVVLNSGVVRDVYELDIVKGSSGRAVHSRYNERIRALPRAFRYDNRRNVLVVGNSWGRDWCNVLIESGVTNEINLVYYSQNGYEVPLTDDVIKDADVVFLVGVYEDRLPDLLKRDDNNIYIVGRKWFGYSCGNFYNRRWRKAYYDQEVQLPNDIVSGNRELAKQYGVRYVDMIECVANEHDGNLYVPIFSDEHKIISQDCQHLTRGGARYYAKILPIRKMLGL